MTDRAVVKLRLFIFVVNKFKTRFDKMRDGDRFKFSIV